MTSSQDAFRVRISGGVQGVCYRAWTRGQALQLGLTGWVRNEADGSVTALIVGTPAATDLVRDLMDVLRQQICRSAVLTSKPASRRSCSAAARDCGW